MPESNENDALKCLQKAMEIQKSYLTSYERPSEVITYEVLRACDDLFCRDLMNPLRAVSDTERSFRDICTFGINHALGRVIPKTLAEEPFVDFPSKGEIQTKVDDFIFNCGLFALSERFEGWIREGLLTAEVRKYPTDQLEHVLLLRSAATSCFDEEIGRSSQRWASDLVWQNDRSEEIALEERYPQIKPLLQQNVGLSLGWQMRYRTTEEIDEYFLDWAKLYLRRISFQDLVDPDDKIGGRPFSRYLDVLTVLSARSQKHIAFAAIIGSQHPHVHIRNLLTTYYSRRLLIEAIADYMDAYSSEVELILSTMTLEGNNLDAHTKSGDMTWPPLIRASTNSLILPTFGIDINPFLFLFTDLRSRYETDWFRVANNREARWITEIEVLFKKYNWTTYGRNVQLREAGNDLTDIDFAAYDPNKNELGLFQLKWQHPVGLDNRSRRSAGKNLTQESNRWIDAVLSWLKRHSVTSLMEKLKLECPSLPKVYLFVLGRYHVHFSGYDKRDTWAIWSDWSHLRRACFNAPAELSIEQLAMLLAAEIDCARESKRGDSVMYPVGNIAVVLNPISAPED